MNPGIQAWTCVSAAGLGRAAFAAALEANVSRLVRHDEGGLATWVGRVDALDAMDPLPGGWDARATRLVALALQTDRFDAAVAAARRRHGAARVGVVLGTSAATIGASEAAYRALGADGAFPPALRHAELHTPHALALWARRALALEGPALTVSTACSSGAKAYAVGARWLQLGVADAVVVGGADALCGSLLYGFHALGLVGQRPAQPFDVARAGISIGEAAAFALLVREPAPLVLQGWGEAGDAFHMSAPHPEGAGAEAALDAALARAGLDAQAVGYVNLHGTASAANDAVEAALVARRYGPAVHASATKGLTGHTMGAAGALESAACFVALEDGLLSGSAGTAAVDPALGEGFAGQLRPQPVRRRVAHAANHAFGFGGSNAVLLFGTA